MKTYHYTTGFSLACILNEGKIQPSHLNANGNELPVIWFSQSDDWEESVAQSRESILDPGVDWGRWRITVKPEFTTLSLHEWVESAQPEPKWAESLMKYVDIWRVSLRPVPCTDWTSIERFDGEKWLSVGWNFVVDRCRARRGEEPLFKSISSFLKQKPSS